MNEYDLIYEELCERVECGELSLEDAEIINDVAYDRYVNEANVYDKLVDKHVDAANKSKKKYYKIMRAQKQYDPNSREYKALEKTKQKALHKFYNHKDHPSLNVDPHNKELLWGNDVYSLRATRKKNSDFDRELEKRLNPHGSRKKEWMKLHGNVGQTPEERYKAGRYDFN